MTVAKKTLLQRASTLLGRDDLARRLGVPPALLEAWIAGDATMPDGQLLNLSRVLDRVAREDRAK
jgi:DNA-binding transcriptional regulator YdaS (Cro superfamily)